MSEEQNMPNVIEDGFGGRWVKCKARKCGLHVVRPGQVQCDCDYDPTGKIEMLESTIATLTADLDQARRERDRMCAECDAERASATAFHAEMQRLRMWAGEFVSRIEQMGVIGISDDADLVSIFREAARNAAESEAGDER